MSKISPKKKRILISSVSAVLVLAIGGGTWFGVAKANQKPVPVFDFSNYDVAITEYWGDSVESRGPVSADNIQTVFLSDTQTVTKVLIKEGDQVKKGDSLMEFDTTLSGLDLERKRLEVEKLKLALIKEEKKLKQINSMRPMQSVPPMPEEEPEEPDLGWELKKPYQISGKKGFDGSSADGPLICWIRNDTTISQELIQKILDYSMEMQKDQLLNQSSPSAQGTVDPQRENGDNPTQQPETVPSTQEPEPSQGTEPPASQETEAPAAPESGLEAWDHLLENQPKPGTVIVKQLELRVNPGMDEQKLDTFFGEGDRISLYGEMTSDSDNVVWAFIAAEGDPSVRGWVPRTGILLDEEAGGEPENPETQPPETEPPATEPPETVPPETQPEPGLRSCYVVLKTMEGNMSLGNRELWQGLRVYENGSFAFFNAMGIPDYTMIADLDEETDMYPNYDFGSGFSAAEIAEMKVKQAQQVKAAELALKMAEADYKIKKREMEDGTIRADFDGVVVTLMTEEDARSQKKPMIKVSGGGGYYVEGTISELAREDLEIGQLVQVSDWNTGEMYDGKVVSVGDFPRGGRGYYGGNPNASVYPFKIFVDGEANLQTGSYVSIQISSAGENGIYLGNPFLRTEDGQSYVYVMGENNRLEKRTVVTGKSIWGSYTQILSGLTAEDLVAFPYGKNVKPGAKAVPGDINDLRG